MTQHRSVRVADHRHHHPAALTVGVVPSPMGLIAAYDRVVIAYVTALAQHAGRADRGEPLVEADHVIEIASLEAAVIVIAGQHSEMCRITRHDRLLLGVPAAVLRDGGIDG